jgi:hypothetical protein
MARESSGQFPNTVSKYRIGLLTAGAFGKLEDLPLMKVGSTNEFSSATNFTQIADFSEDVDGSVLLARRDFGSGSTAARVNLGTGELTSYQQMAASSSGFGGPDGMSLILGNATGALNFYGVTSRTTAVLGQWVTTGVFDPALAELPINQGASNTGVSAPGMDGSTPPPPPTTTDAKPAPYTGPVVESSGTLSSVTRGSKLSLEGSNFTSVTKVTIDGKDAKVSVVSDDLMEITIPTDLANGTYSLVITSNSGELTVQDAVRVANTAGLLGEGATASTKMKDDGTAKVWIFDLVGAGKVQIFVNGKEIAWVNATDANDSKLFNGYLVRTVELAEGKNVIEVLVDGERVRRVSYSG